MPATIYVAPPDLHMMVEEHRVRLVRGPRENRHRPAIDPLFRSAALAFGPRAVGVVLTGSLDDGTAGLFAIKSRDGIAVVQDPTEAAYPSMPESAIQNVFVDYILPVAEIPPLLVTLSRREVSVRRGKAHGNPGGNSAELKAEIKYAEASMDVLSNEDRHPGEPSVFACPECHGALWEVQEGEVLRYRCRVGHAYTSDSLVSGMHDATEEALWTALRAVEEMAALHKRLAARAAQRALTRVHTLHREQTERHERAATVLRNILQREMQTAGNSEDS
jgi:two-component system chemotaxis response regulator CheB